MRKYGDPDKKYEPRNELEAHVCAVLETWSRQDVCFLQTREEYRDYHADGDEKAADPGFDFVVKTSKKWKDWYCSGLEFGVRIEEGDIAAVEQTGWWRA
ncbi:MAG: hypothetical protein ACO1TE_00595 [Prosthecobacter sp.]